MSTLIIPEREMRQHGPGFVLAVCWRQWRTERQLARRGIHFRSTAIAQLVAAYSAMDQAEFDAINGPQAWANWRTIPRALSGHVPNRPLRIVDLGCGTGSSTQVLAFYAPAGSHITGYEIADPMIPFARNRRYLHQSGVAQRIDFVCQPINEILKADGAPLPERSVDVIHSSGVIGFHLNEQTVLPLIAEVDRLLSPDGAALLDVGPTLPGPTMRRLLSEAGFDFKGHYRSWFGDRTGEMVFKRK